MKRKVEFETLLKEKSRLHIYEYSFTSLSVRRFLDIRTSQNINPPLFNETIHVSFFSCTPINRENRYVSIYLSMSVFVCNVCMFVCVSVYFYLFFSLLFDRLVGRLSYLSNSLHLFLPLSLFDHYVSTLSPLFCSGFFILSSKTTFPLCIS